MFFSGVIPLKKVKIIKSCGISILEKTEIVWKAFTMPAMEHCDWFILQLLLPTPTMEFSLNRKRRSQKWDRYSASDSDLIFTRWYHSAFLITTPTPAQSLAKTSL